VMMSRRFASFSRSKDVCVCVMCVYKTKWCS
jgi:hypothetical protein